MPIWIMYRPVKDSPTGTHCYFRIVQNGNVTTIGLHPMLMGLASEGPLLIGHIYKNNPADSGGLAVPCLPPSWQTEEKLVECIRAYANAYPKGRYVLWGPNSNTFVANCVRHCLGQAMEEPPGAFGWDMTPPTPA